MNETPTTLKARVMQFCAGPETHLFAACREHEPELERNGMCFLVIPAEPIVTVDAEDHDCYFCREGGD